MSDLNLPSTRATASSGAEPTEPRPRAYSYLRFSTPEQERGDSLRRQTSMAEAYAAMHGLELDARSYQDLGVSAFRGANAETGMLGEFLDLVRAKVIPHGSYMLVESMDRLSRNKPRKAVRLLERLCEEGITVVTLSDGKVYDEASLDDDPMAFMWAFMVAMRANEESATKSRRLKEAWKSKRGRATQTPLTARAPHWLRLDRSTRVFEIIEDRAAVVGRIFDMTLNGTGQHRITEILNKEGVPVFGRGLRWHRSYVAKLLSNPAVIGRLIPHVVEYDQQGHKVRQPTQPVDGYYPPIIDSATFEHVQAMSRDVRSPLRGRHARSGSVSNLFGGLARCPLCGGTMTRVNKGAGGGRPYLVCAAAKAGGGCKYHGIPYERVESRFIEDADLIAATVPAGDGDDELDERIDRIEAALSAIDDFIEDIFIGIERGGPATSVERQKLRALEAEREQKQQELSKLEDRRAETAGPLVAERLTKLTAALHAPELDRRQVNVLLRQLLTGVVVHYLAGRLVLEWRHGGESYVHFALPDEEYLRSEGRAF
jgi:DNA invertase Pin-like site-specific DNA recombinase